MRGKFFGYLLCLGGILGLLACSGAGSLDERDERDPRLVRARALKSAQDYDGAISWYNKALERRPNLARAHLELGLIYDQQLNDDIRAIYHYERYLELRPEAEKKQIVEELIGHAKISFAASLPDKPSSAIREIDILKKEIATLRSLLAEAQAAPANSGGAATEKARSKSKSASKSTEKQAAAESQPVERADEAYVVQAGDTLSRIATRVYNDPNKWNDIFEANRAALPSPQSIKVGQTLVIPR